MSELNNENGLVYVFTGEGKGKTSAALGVTVRMLLNKKKVVWISWYKEEKWGISEMKLIEHFRDDLRMFWMGYGFYIAEGEEQKMGNSKIKTAKVSTSRVYDMNTPDGHKRAAEEALNLAKRLLVDRGEAGGMPIDLLVLDEAVQAVKDELLDEEDLIKVLGMRGSTHVVLTGRGLTKPIKDEADLVSEIAKVRHPFDRGSLAVKGLDF